MSGLVNSANSTEVAKKFEANVLPAIQQLCYTTGAIIKYAFTADGIHIYALKQALNDTSSLFAKAYVSVSKMVQHYSPNESLEPSNLASILSPHITILDIFIKQESDEACRERLITIKGVYETMAAIYNGKSMHPKVTLKIIDVANTIRTAKSLEPNDTKGNIHLKEWPVLKDGEVIMNQEAISKYTAPNKIKYEWISAIDLRCKRAKTLIVANSSKAPAPQVKQERKEQDRLGGGGGSNRSSNNRNNDHYNQGKIDYEDRRTNKEKLDDEREDQKYREASARDRQQQARIKANERWSNHGHGSNRQASSGGGGGSSRSSDRGQRNDRRGGGGGSSRTSGASNLK
jgi:uncharacterized membrane protein YgcG